MLIASNLLIKLCDFGESMHEDAKFDKSFKLARTLPYTAPEILKCSSYENLSL